ncbi:MAG: hypothetical protein OXE95_05390 [Chloroflexi bacterium]|nr:hypothetical protein [Chloroflexota bacterium]MCY4246996.1 hypothetical protein [Chloroflexota bacterium]
MPSPSPEQIAAAVGIELPKLHVRYCQRDAALYALGIGAPADPLRGLCTFGFAARAIIKACCGNDASRLRSIRARFSQERDAVVLSHAAARLMG